MIALLAGDEPRERLVQLIARILPPIGAAARPVLERLVHERRTDRRLVLAGGEERRVAEEHVLVRVRDLQDVDARVLDHRVQCPDDRPVDVVLLLRAREGPIGPGELARLRRRLAQPANGPRVVRVDLMIHPGHPVPHVVVRERRRRQLGTRDDVQRAAAVLVDALEVHEVVQLVLDDRSAEIAAPLNLPRLRLRQILLLGEVVALGHRLILIEEESRAVERVGALLRYRVDDAARARSELGVELAGEQLELLHRFHRYPRLRAAVPVVEAVVVAGAVERVIHVPHVLAVHRHRIRAERIGRDRGGDAGQQAQIRGEVAVDRGYVGELLRADAAAELLRRRVDDGRFGQDGHLLLDAAHLELHVDRLRASDFDAHALALVLLEAGQLRVDFVGARRQRAHEERPVGAADDLAEDAARFVARDNGDAGQHRALLVHDAAAELARALLGECCGGCDQKRCDDDHANRRLSSHESPRSDRNRGNFTTR